MSLLNPIWLWALGALSIPVAIHLLSRKEGKTIKIGSIRFLSETSTSKFSSIRLNEVALLVIRTLFILLLVVFLAGLIISFTGPGNSTPWVLIEKGLEDQDHIKTLTDSLKKNGYEIRRLSEGFPDIEADTNQQTPDYYKLVEELSTAQSDRSIVIASNRAANFKGKRIPLPENVTWLPYPLSQSKNLESESSNKKRDTLRITLLYAKEFLYDKKILTAALNTIQDAGPKKVLFTEVFVDDFRSAQDSDWLICLLNGVTVTSRKMLYFKENPFGDLIEQESGNKWVLTHHLSETNAIEQHLPAQLMQMLFYNETSSNNHEIVTFPDKFVWSKISELKSSAVIEGGQPADKILILIIVSLFICERILAFYRRQ